MDKWLKEIKDSLRGYQVIFRFLYMLTTPVFGKSPKSILEHIPVGGKIINLGSGVLSIDPRVIDVDFYPYPNVKVVADAANLPFENNSIDGIICQSLLEHVSDADAVIKEIKRVLKSGGWLYVSVPFILGFHSAPMDYRRWTAMGLEKSFAEFEEKSSGPACGPTLAFTRIAGEWLSLVLSFGISGLYQLWNLFFMLIFLPVNLLDYVFIRYKFASNFAMTVYFMGKKKSLTLKG